jgi:toxin ParE1/3/4
MALRLVIAPRARRDLEDILSYIAAEDRSAATKMAGRFDKAIRILAERPFIGPPAGRLGDRTLRRFSVSPYIIFYRPEATKLEIVRVLHSSMDLDRPGLLDTKS